jgi:uncharacterized membrane protein
LDKRVTTIPKSRLEAISDGIFAIAMTIIVLELKVPDEPEFGLGSEKIFQFLYSILPKVETYSLSFIIAGVFWMRHQLQFMHIKGVDRAIITINLIFLLFVTFIPFSTGFVMDFPNTEIPFLIYGFNLWTISMMLVINWLYVTRNKMLMLDTLTDKEIREFTILTYVAPVIFTIAIVFSLINVRIATFMLYLEPTFYIFFRTVKKVNKVIKDV